MESMLLGALAVAGFNSNPKDKKNLKTNNYKSNDLEKRYSSNMQHNMDSMERNQAQSLGDSIREKRPEYFKQFDELTFDNISEPVSVNEAHITISGTNSSLQRNLNLFNGYSNVEDDLNYRVVTKENFTHNNMTPNTSKRDYAINDSRTTRKLEAFTGVNEHYVPKQEKYNLFEPMKNLTYVDGMPVFTDYLDDRYLPSNKNNNGNLPFETNIKVKPGIQNDSRQGLGTVYRIMPRSTDALRGDHNQKISYMNKPLETIKKGEYRGPDFNLTKYKLPDFRETKFEDLVPVKTAVEGPMKTGKYTNVTTQRNEEETYHAGPGVNRNVGSGPSKSKTQFTEAKKENYFNDMAHGVGAVEVKPILLNTESYANRDNQRTTSSHNIVLGSKAENAGGAVYQSDKAKETIRQTTSHDIVLGAAPERKSTNVLPTDLAKKTIRQTTSHNIVLGSKPEYASGNVQPTDKAKKTIRETTSHNLTLGAQPEYSTGIAPLTDKAKITIRQTTSHNKILGAQPENLGPAVYKTDEAKRTIRETTSHNKILGAQPENLGPAVYQTDEAKTTIRETTSHNKILGAQPENLGPAVYQTDGAKKTIRETTSHNKILGAQPENLGPAVYQTDGAKKTIRQTTSHNVILGANPENMGPNVQPTDKAKATIRQTTSHNVILGAKPEYASGNVQPTDKAKSTIRQTTLYTTPGMNVANTVAIGYTKDEKDIAKPTIRQTTENTQYEGPAGGVDNYTGYARDEKDEAKPTIRQTTENNQYEGPAATSAIGYTRDEKDAAKPTIRQTTENTEYEGPLGGGDNYTGYARDRNDRAKTTIKQTTLLTDYTGQMTGNVDRPTSHIASENMTIRETREIGNYNRIAAGGANLAGPQINNANVKMNGKKTSVYYVPHPSKGLDNNITPSSTKPIVENKKPQLDYGNYYTNNIQISTLNDNPYVNDLYHQKNIKF